MIDNRYAPGSTWAVAPDTFLAAYSARWIDQGDTAPAGIVPDRQGFAYEHAQYRDILQGDLARLAPRCSIGTLDRDITTIPWDAITSTGTDLRVTIALRRAGGYVYCDAWLTS